MSERLRVGMFSESFDPVQNGVTTSVTTLVDGLRALAHHVFVFAPAHEQQRPDEADVMRFPSFVSAFNRGYPLAYPFLPRLTLETHFDDLKLQIVHTHTPFVLGLTGAKLALRRGVPLVTTFHTLYSHYSHYVPLLPDSVTQSLIEHYLPWYYNRCAEIICPSTAAECELRALGVTRPIEVIPSGIPLPTPGSIDNAARQSVRQRLGLSSEVPLLLYAGRLAPEKCVDWLLQVFARIHFRLPEARLMIAGGGDQLDDLQASAVQLGIAAAVMFLGPLPRREMDSIFAAADVFCFPSPTETQGLVIGEARAAGAPCVVVDAGGAPETVRHGEDGFRVPPGDEEAFAFRVLSILLDRSLADRMRVQARRQARQFTPERMVQRVLSLYARARSETLPRFDPEARSPVDSMDWEGDTDALIDGPAVAESA